MTSVDDVVLTDVPGVWTPGVPKAASLLPISVDEMRDLIRENDLPLKETKTAAPPEDAPITGADDQGEELTTLTPEIEERESHGDD